MVYTGQNDNRNRRLIIPLEDLLAVSAARQTAATDSFAHLRANPKALSNALDDQLLLLRDNSTGERPAPHTSLNRKSALASCLAGCYVRYWLWNDTWQTLLKMRALGLDTKGLVVRVAHRSPELYFRVSTLRANLRVLKELATRELRTCTTTWGRCRPFVDMDETGMVQLNDQGRRLEETADGLDLAMLQICGSDMESGCVLLFKESRGRSKEIPRLLLQKLREYTVTSGFLRSMENSPLWEAIEALDTAVMQGPRFAIHGLCEHTIFSFTKDDELSFLETPSLGTRTTWSYNLRMAELRTWQKTFIAPVVDAVSSGWNLMDIQQWPYDGEGYSQFWEDIDSLLEDISNDFMEGAMRVAEAFGLYLVVRVYEDEDLELFTIRVGAISFATEEPEYAPSAHSYRLEERRTKEKTRPQKREQAPYVPRHAEHDLRDFVEEQKKPPVFAVTKDSLAVFRTIFPDPNEPREKMGSISWEMFLRAMVDVGFEIDMSGAGSACNLRPPNEYRDLLGWKPVAFHRPHKEDQASKLENFHIVRFRKRLHQHYDWTFQNFVAKGNSFRGCRAAKAPAPPAVAVCASLLE